MIYVFLADGFEEVEALTPIDLLRRAELEVVTVGVTGKTVTGSHGIAVAADITAEEVDMNRDVQMLVLPGGMPGTLNLEKSEIVRACIQVAMTREIYLAAICAAPSILGHMGLLEGKKAACYVGFEEQLTGATATKEAVVQDGRFITARGAGVALPFALKLTEVLRGSTKAMALKESLLCEG